MKRLANDQSAISEIVGALMLILIVVIAASSLAVFVSQQQKILQDNQMLKTEQQGELLLISSINIDSDQNGITVLNLTISSMHQDSSQIDRISINDHVLNKYNYTSWDDLGKHQSVQNYTTAILVASQQTIYLSVKMSADFNETFHLTNDSSISVKIFTALSNEFDKVFYAPTPIISINTESQWNSIKQNYTSFLILDGSGSDQPGDATIMKWNWTIHDANGNHSEYGRKVRFDPNTLAGHNLTISLTTENTNGMIGTANTTYYI